MAVMPKITESKGKKMKYCFIINPRAGKGKFVDRIKGDVKNACEKKGISYDIFVSEKVEDTHTYIKELAQSDGEELSFIACGGDGTLCQTIHSVMSLPDKCRENVAVGVIPIGTGNDFVSNFDPKETFFDIDAQLSSTIHNIDLIKCNDTYSVNMVNVGFDSHVVCTKEKIGRKKWVPRKLAYIFSLVLTLVKKPGLNVDISCDGQEAVHHKLLLTTLANGAFCGGGFNSNPLASLTDGMIDMLTVTNMSRRKFITLVGDYKKGTHLGEKFKNIVENFKCSYVDLQFSEETPVSVDGEIVRTDKLSLSVEQGALRFLLPKGVLPKVKALCEKIEREIADAISPETAEV